MQMTIISFETYQKPSKNRLDTGSFPMVISRRRKSKFLSLASYHRFDMQRAGSEWIVQVHTRQSDAGLFGTDNSHAFSLPAHTSAIAAP